MPYVTTKRNLCEMIWNSEDIHKDPVQKILDQLRKTDVYTENQFHQIESELERKFKARYKFSWNSSKVSRKRVKFEENYGSWLDSRFIVYFEEDENAAESEDDNVARKRHRAVVDIEAQMNVSVPNDMENQILPVAMEEENDALPRSNCDEEDENGRVEHSIENPDQDENDFENDDISDREYNDDELNELVAECAAERTSETEKIVGRPSVPYKTASRSTQHRLNVQLAKESITPQLAKALEIRKNMSINYGKLDSKDMTSYAKLSKILAMYVDLNFSTRRYNVFRKHNKDIAGCELYPPYPCIQLIKRGSYPNKMEFTETGARADVDSLIEHTITKILLVVGKEKFAAISKKQLTLVGKWGSDGAGEQQTTMQKWQEATANETDMDESDIEDDLVELVTAQPKDSDTNKKRKRFTPQDQSVVCVSFVPLQLKTDDSVLWENPTPSSVNYCRPIEFEFTKETDEHVAGRYAYYKEQLAKDKCLEFKIDRFRFTVNLDFECTMIDGKTSNVLTGQKCTRSCNICNVGYGKINDLKYIQENCQSRTEYYCFGLSTLHGWIRCFEYIIHLSYNLDFQKGAARTAEYKRLKAERKLKVQESLRRKMSLLVDIVKQGSGTTNTGNVAREFFRHPKLASECTGVNQRLIERFHAILQVLTSSTKPKDIGKFRTYALQTYELCVRLYGWYPMPPSVHKILLHGADIIEIFHLPIGWYSEEAQESNNKHFRLARSDHSRMFNRTKTNEDIFKYLLIRTDPYLVQFRVIEKMQHYAKTDDAKFLLN